MSDYGEPGLVRSFSHEASNSLFVVLSNLEFLLADEHDAARRQVMEEARRAIGRLKRRVGELEAAHQARVQAAVDLVPPLKELVARARAGGVRVRLSATGAVPAAVDPQLVVSVVEGLLDGVPVEGRARTLSIELERGAEGARIRVAATPAVEWPRNEFVRLVLAAHGGSLTVAEGALVLDFPTPVAEVAAAPRRAAKRRSR